MLILLLSSITIRLYDYYITVMIITINSILSVLLLFMSLPSGKHTKNYGKSPFSMDKSTINHHVQ